MIEWFSQNIFYQYRIAYIPQGDRLRPLMPIQLRYGRASLDLLAIVDSGADFSTFSTQVAEALRVDLNRLVPTSSRGTSGSVRTWNARLELTVSGLQFPNCPVLFVDNPDCPALLGREPVFEKLQIGFKQSAWEFYLTPLP